MNPTKGQVAELVRHAFKGVPHPGSEALVYDRHAEGCPEIIRDFARKPWEVIGVETLFTHRFSLSFFSAAGFRFYFPAFLLAALDDADVEDAVLNALAPADAGGGLTKESATSIHAELFSLFDAPQLDAVKAFARYVSDRLGEEAEDWPGLAPDGPWLKD